MDDESSRGYYEPIPPNMGCWKERKCWQKTLIILAIVIFTLLFLAFIAIWVIFPIVFMNTVSLQRFFVFMNIDAPKNPDYENPLKYNIKGVFNTYITTSDYEQHFNKSLSIGVWVVKHIDDINNKETDFNTILQESRHPVLLYLHGVACNRVLPVVAYNALRKHFLVIGIDYRGFGDSGPDVTLTELGVAYDNIQVYKWVQERTTAPMYVWGHSLGTALSTLMVRLLREEKNIVPMGLILESPFTTMREEIINHPLGKIFSWLAYFEATILDPLIRNGFHFYTTTNILRVDCPIMIMHAEDDNIIPYTLGRKLYEIASTKRDPITQGNVTYHQFGRLGYKHVNITIDVHIPKFVREFIGICEDWNAHH